MVADSEQEISSTDDKSKLVAGNHQTNLDLIRRSIDEMQQKQTDIHRHIVQLSSIMADFEYHLAPIRNFCDQSNDKIKQELCQSFLSNLDAVMCDTRSALSASTASATDAEQVQELVRKLYEENHRIAEHIDVLLEENSTEPNPMDEDHVQKALEHIELAFEQNVREQQTLERERSKYDHNQNTIETFLQTTEKLHRQALEKLRAHVQLLREQNQSLRQYNEQMEFLSKQIPEALLLSTK